MTSSRGEGSSHWNGITVGEQAQAHIGHSYTTNIQITEERAKAVFKACTLSRETFGPFIAEIGEFRVLLQDTKDAAESQELESKHARRFGAVLEGCNKCLVDLEAFVVRYNGLPTSTQRSWDRISHIKEEMEDLKGRLGRSLVSLNSISGIITTSLLVQQRLEKFIDEVRTGKREGSVISTYSIAASSLHEAADWKLICKELQDVGITAKMFADHKTYICETLQKMVESGELQEQAPASEIQHIAMYITPQDDLRNPILYQRFSARGTQRDRVRRIENVEPAISREATSNGPHSALTESNSEQRSARTTQPHVPLSQQISKMSKVSRALANVFSSPNKSLLQAAETGNSSEVRRALEAGANIKTENNSGEPSLILAYNRGHSHTVEFLLEMGVDINGKNSRGQTLLGSASRKGDSKLVKYLIEKGANVDAKDDYGQRPLFLAICYKRNETVSLLLDLGADLQGKDGCSPLCTASEVGDDTVVELLLARGIFVEGENSNGETALIGAVSRNQISIVEILLNCGAQVNVRNIRGESALQIATKAFFPEITELLIEAGADSTQISTADIRSRMSQSARNTNELWLRRIRREKKLEGEKQIFKALLSTPRNCHGSTLYGTSYAQDS